MQRPLGISWNMADTSTWRGILYRIITIKPASKLFNTICGVYKKNTCACCLMLEDSFWLARHNLHIPIAKWITHIIKETTDLSSFKLTPRNQKICDFLLCNLENSWKPIHDHLVYSPNEFYVDNEIGALEFHEVLIHQF